MVQSGVLLLQLVTCTGTTKQKKVITIPTKQNCATSNLLKAEVILPFTNITQKLQKIIHSKNAQKRFYAL
jgi:hypothetical protein